MQYSELTEDEQLQILKQRRRQYEAEHFNHSVNKELLVASGNTDEDTKKAIEASNAAMKTLDSAHAETVKKIEKIEKAKK